MLVKTFLLWLKRLMLSSTPQKIQWITVYYHQVFPFLGMTTGNYAYRVLTDFSTTYHPRADVIPYLIL
jgi:hypothetical protein